MGIGLLFALGCGAGDRSQPNTGASTSRGTGGTVAGTGTGGAPIGTGGTAGSAADTCGMHEPLGNILAIETTGPGAWTTSHPFEGAAVVERSTADDITLYFEPPHTTMGTGGADGTAGPPRGYHVTLYPTRWTAFPLLPVGAKVWLTKDPDGNQVASTQTSGFLPWKMAIYDRQGGILIMQSERGADLVRSSPCSVPRTRCPLGTSTFYKVDVPADSPVTLRDSEEAVIMRGGRSYDVRVTSQAETQVTEPNICFDYRVYDLTCLDLKIRDVAGLTFEMAKTPACIEGNDRFPSINFAVAGAPSFDGIVTYLQRTSDTFYFDAGGGITASISGPAPIAEPTPGQRLWLTIQDGICVLRASQRGEILIAVLSPSEPWTAARQLLGVSVTLEQDCAYSTVNAVDYLQRVAFGSTPPVTIRSGSSGMVSIDGQSYRVATKRGRATIWK